LISESEKDLLYMQAEAAIAALSSVDEPTDADLHAQAKEIVNRHCEYMDGLARGQIMMRTSNAIEAVKEALAKPSLRNRQSRDDAR
jgi:hypothetical protein